MLIRDFEDISRRLLVSLDVEVVIDGRSCSMDGAKQQTNGPKGWLLRLPLVSLRISRWWRWLQACKVALLVRGAFVLLCIVVLEDPLGDWLQLGVLRQHTTHHDNSSGKDFSFGVQITAMG